MPQEPSQIQEVLISEIELTSLLRRGDVDQDKLAGLARSMEEVGLLSPVRLARSTGEGKKYALVDGLHRTLGGLKLGWKAIPAIVEDKPFSEGEHLHKGLVGNNQRIDNTPVETAEGIARLMEVTGWNATTVAAKLGFSDTKVSNLLKLLQLPEAIRERVHRGEIAPSTAVELGRAKDRDQQESVAAQIVAGELSTRDSVAGSIRSGRNGGVNTAAAPSRVTAKLDGARAVTVTGESIDLEAFIETLEEVLGKARRARTQGVAVGTFIKMLRDQAKAGGEWGPGGTGGVT
jgi:ParB/RepB/Spo0J family partition protein